MAVNAKFIADFTSFTEAVNKAQVQLKSFETGADKVERSLNKMSNSFTGTKIIQDAALMTAAVERTGGAAKLADTEMRKLTRTIADADDKMKALGQRSASSAAFLGAFQKTNQQTADSFRSLFASTTATTTASTAAADSFRKLFTVTSEGAPKIAALTTAQTSLFAAQTSGVRTQDSLTAAVLRYASVAVVGAAVMKTLQYASSLEKLAAATGAGIQGAQALENIAVSTNTSVGALGSGVNELARRLADGDASAVGAMQKLGISTERFMQLRADQQFIQVAAALGRVSDQGQKAALARDLFRNWQEIIVAMRPDVEALSNSVSKMSDADVKNIAAVENAWNATLLAAQRYGAWVLNMAIPKGPSPFIQNSLDWVGGQVRGFVAPIFGGIPRSAGTNNAPGAARQSDAERRQQEAMATVFGNPEAEAIVKKWEADQIKQADQFKNDRAAFLLEWRAVQNWIGERRMEDAFRQMHANDLPEDILKADTIARGQTPFDMARLLRSQVTEIDSRRIGTGLGIGPAPIGPGNVAFDRPNADALAFAESIDRLAASFATLAQIAGDSLNSVVRDIGNMVAATNLGITAGKGMSDSFKQIEKGGKQGAAGYANLAASAIAAFAAMEQATSSASRARNVIGGITTGASIGNEIAGPLGAAIGAGAGALFGWVRSNTIESRMVSPGRDAFFEKQGGLAGFNKTLMEGGASWADTERLAKGLFDAKTPEQWEKAVNAATVALKQYGDAALIAAGNVEALANRQSRIDAGLSQFMQAHQRLEDLAKKHGFSKEETQAALGQGRTNVTAATLMNELQLLEGGGFKTDDILKRMDGSFDKLVQDAMKFGTVLPESMRPVLQRLIEMGLLTDEAGKKIEDLDDVEFGKTLPDSLNDLTEALRDLISAITGVPRTIPVPVIVTDPREPKIPGGETQPEYAHTGGVINWNGIRRYHEGGVMQPYRGLQYGEMPFIGQVGEGVVNKRAMSALGTSWLSGVNRNPDAFVAAATRASGGYSGSGQRNPADLIAAATRSSGGYNAPPPAIKFQPRATQGGVTVNVNINAIDGASVQRVAPEMAREVANVVNQGGAAQTRFRGSMGISRVNFRKRR